MRIGDLLKNKRPRISTILAAETLSTALRVMHDDHVSLLVVKDVCRTEHETALGTISERDVITALSRRGPAALKQPVRDAMAHRFITCKATDSVGHVLALMNRHALYDILVLEAHTMIGVVNIRDLVSAELGQDTGSDLERAEAVA